MKNKLFRKALTEVLNESADYDFEVVETFASEDEAYDYVDTAAYAPARFLENNTDVDLNTEGMGTVTAEYPGGYFSVDIYGETTEEYTGGYDDQGPFTGEGDVEWEAGRIKRYEQGKFVGTV